MGNQDHGEKYFLEATQWPLRDQGEITLRARMCHLNISLEHSLSDLPNIH